MTISGSRNRRHDEMRSEVKINDLNQSYRNDDNRVMALKEIIAPAVIDVKAPKGNTVSELVTLGNAARRLQSHHQSSKGESYQSAEIFKTRKNWH